MAISIGASLFVRVVAGLGHEVIAREIQSDHSQQNGRKLSDVAAAVVDSHLLLVPAPTPSERPD